MKFRRETSGLISGVFMLFGGFVVFALQLFFNDFHIGFLIIGFLFVFGSILGFSCAGEYVYISEKGISCKKRNDVLWDFDWNEIDYLYLVRLRFPRVYIILKGSKDDIIALSEKGFSIEYRFIVRKALKKYCTKNKNCDWYNIYYTKKIGDDSLSSHQSDTRNTGDD